MGYPRRGLDHDGSDEVNAPLTPQVIRFDLTTRKATTEPPAIPPDNRITFLGSPANDATGRKLKFLRKIPIDPMTRTTEWGLRSYQDKPDATRWGGQNVFDVYTTFDGKALDGSKYRDW